MSLEDRLDKVRQRLDREEERLIAMGKRDALEVFLKDRAYNGSWKARGGMGAFFVIARKWDRLEQSVQSIEGVQHYDLFGCIEHDPREEGILDDIRDLRRYLMLVEEEMIEREVIDEHGLPVSNYVKKEDT